MKLTDNQKKQIHCVKHGHSHIVTTCFGYINCARCKDQLGDTLGGSFNLDSYVVVGHVGRHDLKDKGCYCTENYESLPEKDKKLIDPKILRKLDIDLRKSKKSKAA